MINRNLQPGMLVIFQRYDVVRIHPPPCDDLLLNAKSGDVALVLELPSEGSRHEQVRCRVICGVATGWVWTSSLRKA